METHLLTLTIGMIAGAYGSLFWKLIFQWEAVHTSFGCGRETNNSLSSVLGRRHFRYSALQTNPEVRDVGEDKSGAEQMEFAEDWSQKWISLENSL